jgi:hypothetical protein
VLDGTLGEDTTIVVDAHDGELTFTPQAAVVAAA